MTELGIRQIANGCAAQQLVRLSYTRRLAEVRVRPASFAIAPKIPRKGERREGGSLPERDRSARAVAGPLDR